MSNQPAGHEERRSRVQEWSISALCEECRLDRQTLIKKLEASGAQYRFDAKKNAKLYLMVDVIKALQEASPVRKLDIDLAKARKVTAEAGIAEIELAKEQGEVIELDVVEAILTEEYSAVRAKLLNLPSKLAPILDGMAPGIEAKRQLLTKEINEALDELKSEGAAAILDTAAEIRAATTFTEEDQQGETGRVPSASNANGQSVGGRKTKAKR